MRTSLYPRKKSQIQRLRDALAEAAARYTQQWVAHHFGVSQKTVSEWLSEDGSRDPILRLREFLRELCDEDSRDLALIILRELCAAADCIPIQRPDSDIGSAAIFDAFGGTSTAASKLDSVFWSTFGDFILEKNEAEQNLKCVNELIEKLSLWKNLLVALDGEIESHDGAPLVLSADEIQKKIRTKQG